jgi:CDP-diacylglycerol--glycerol-3-phosphate 3-phosphatidyltransferase
MNPRVKISHRLFPVFSEIRGVLHSKLLIFDNFTIVTGANLSHNYFTTRQDRYYIIQDCEPFADYCEDYLNACKTIYNLYL